MRALVVVLSVLLFATDVTYGFQWIGQLQPGTKLEVCQGENVDFLWELKLSSRELENGFNWRRQLKYGPQGDLTDGKSESDLIIFSDSPRFQYTPGKRLSIKGAIINDTGNYTIKVNVMDSGTGLMRAERNTVSLLVKDAPVLSGGSLHASLEPDAVKIEDGPDSGWHIVLACGKFENLGHPPVNVVWQTPSNVTLPSTKQVNGVFYLTAPNPVLNGEYSCQIEPEAPALDCLGKEPTMTERASVLVDGTYVAKQMIDAGRYAEIESKLDELEKKRAEVSKSLEGFQNENLATYDDLLQRTGELEEKAKKLTGQNLAFHTRLADLKKISRENAAAIKALKKTTDETHLQIASKVDQISNETEDKLLRAIRPVKADVIRLGSRAAETEQNYQQLNEKVEKLGNMLGKVERRLKLRSQKLDEKLKATDGKLESANRKYEKLRGQWVNRMHYLNKQISNISSSANERLEKLEKLAQKLQDSIYVNYFPD